MNYLKAGFVPLLLLCLSLWVKAQKTVVEKASVDPATVFLHPPESARPGVLWMWMGSNLSKSGITKDLEALKAAGFNRTTMFSLADVTTPWAGYIQKSPTPQLISWTEPWWLLVRHAALESKRLGMDFGMFNGPSYSTSGGKWITPELSMQEIIWSADTVAGNTHFSGTLKKPQVNPRANQSFPHHNPETGKLEKPIMEARKTFYKDIAVLAVPARGVIAKDSSINLTERMTAGGQLDWEAPPGEWVIYRFGHTTRGTLIQPAQWEATGLECDKMSPEAVNFHMDHVIGEIKKHLGDLVGSGFTHVHFDSYEAGYPTWTPAMRADFLRLRGYDLISWLPAFAKRRVGSQADSAKFANDFDATIKDLYRDVYFTTIANKLKAAGLRFLCEPYGGPWRQDEIMPLIPSVMTEFWTHGGRYEPVELEATVAALRKSGQNIVEAEAFTGDPRESKWSETPAWLKPIGDAAFCAGVNRLILHRFVQQPWDDKYQPGNTMGQWGTHFDRTQTWWKPAAAMVRYWTRCQALLQWGKIVLPSKDDFTATTGDSLSLKFIHRSGNGTDIYFVANTARREGNALCSFKTGGKRVELWDPVSCTMSSLPESAVADGRRTIPLHFAAAQSFFIVFKGQGKAAKMPANKKEAVQMKLLDGPWKVTFDAAWGGPKQPVTFDSLQDWTTHSQTGIRYYSGTAIYTKTFDAVPVQAHGATLFLDLGLVQHIASVRLNGKSLGVVWTAPWRSQIPPGLLQEKGNRLEIAVTNVWANRLIGDEQEPADVEWLPAPFGGGAQYMKAFPAWFLNGETRPSKGRYCFTTWNYFSRDSPLIPSGLLGPVRLMAQE